MSFSTQMFAGSHDFTTGGDTFSSIGISIEESEKGLLELFRHSSSSALFNAEARFPPPKCHPGTRESILEDLENWVHLDPSRSNPVRWLYGPAGAGKSAIAQTLAETLMRDNNLAASFFFWRSDDSRNSAHQLFTTISLQLAAAIPELRSIINLAVLRDFSTLTSSIETQFDTLVLQPCLEAVRAPNSSLTSRVRILIIDGLDECSDSCTQQRILFILAHAMQEHTLPFRVLIASRPEPWIKEAFSSSHFQSICHWMSLGDMYQASIDIRKFLQDRFHEILNRHLSTMEHIARPWPSSGQIEILVSKASGQFAYASTVLKYIDDDSAVPADRLDIVLGLQQEETESEEPTAPFAELDALYRQILSTKKNTAILLRILGVLIIHKETGIYFTLNSELGIQEFITILCIPLAMVQAALSACHSLFQGPSPVDSGFKFAHASFEEFLLDPSRSLHFYIDKPTWHGYLAQYCLDILIKDQYWPLTVEVPLLHPHKFSHSYNQCLVASRNWMHYCLRGNDSDELLLKLQSFDVYAASTRIWQLYIGRGRNFQWKSVWEYVLFMRDLFQLRDHFVQPTTNNYQLETRHKQYINNIWDITTVGFCMRFLDSERKESFNIPVYLRLPPPFRWDRDFLVATIEEQLLLVRDRSFSSMEVIPLEHW